MNIFTAFNDAYAVTEKVMMKSLILNEPGALTIYVFYASLQPQTMASLRELEVPGRVSFRFERVDDSFLSRIQVPGRFSRETCYRLFADRLFDETVDRALWLDGDLIVNGPLAEFYNQDFQGKLFVALEDMDPEVCAQRHALLDMPADAPYINSGVLLMNVKGMREELDGEAILRYMEENISILDLIDQDTFNGLLHDRFLVVDPEHIHNYFSLYLNKDNEKAVYRTVRILHYCGYYKPWKKGYPAAGFRLWWKYALKAGPEYKKLFWPVFFTYLMARPLTPKYIDYRFRRLAKRCFPRAYAHLKRRFHKEGRDQSS